MQQGGELLGQGSYGCAFDPPLDCKRELTTKMNVGKITSISEAHREYSMSLALEELPYSEEYFVLIKDSCIPKARSNQKDKSLSKCKTLEGVKLPSRIQLLMPFGGKPLAQIQFNSPGELYLLGKKLLEAGTLLLLGGVVHADIHGSNIVVDSTGNIKIIDLGKSWSVNSLNEENVPNYYFNPRPPATPPEENVISAVNIDMDLDLAMAKITDEKLALGLIYKITGQPIASQLNGLKTFIKSSQAFRKKNWLSYYKIYWKKFDAWGFGSVLLVFYINNLMSHNSSDSRNELWQKCILGLCEIDPGKRLDASEALELWAPDSKILQIPEVQEMLEKQKELRSQLINKIGVF